MIYVLFGKNNLNNSENDEKKDSIDNKSEVNSFTPTIYIDIRENNDLLKELYQSTTLQIKAEKLDVGDIVISEITAVERKSKKDFITISLRSPVLVLRLSF